MSIEPVVTDCFDWDGRGPSLIRWLHGSDKLFPDTFAGEWPDGICGAEYGLPPDLPPSSGTSIVVVDPAACDRAWVVFHGLQVIQIVPEEVHSYWHSELLESAASRSGVWKVTDSEWMRSFSPRHLGNCSHFILEFYDDLVEVIAEALIFGRGAFRLEQVIAEDRGFAYAYLWRAYCREKWDEKRAAAEDFRAYARIEQDPGNAEYARKKAERLEKETGLSKPA